MIESLNKKETIGFIGLGAMGSVMASHLLKAGLELNLWARNPSSLKPFQQTSARLFPDAAALFKYCSIVFLNVTGTSDVESLLLSDTGAAHFARPGTLIVDFSTIDAKACQKFEAVLRKDHQIDFLDCPVSGGSAGARSASLTMMAGGTPGAFERALPYLKLLGKTIQHVGPCGAGQAIKAANQMAMCIQLAGIAEAFTYAKAQGADLQACLELLSAGLAGSKVLDWAGPHIVNQFKDQATIESRLHAKDMNMISQSALAEGLNLPMTQHTTGLLNELLSMGLGHDDTSRLFEIVQSKLKA